MKPTRAAWLFAAGLAWLVLRAVLVQAVPLLRTDQLTERGGLLLVVPLISVAASLTIPLFFGSFLLHHDFSHRPLFRTVAIAAALSSLGSFGLVVVSFVANVLGGSPTESGIIFAAPWLYQLIPLFFVGSLVPFLAVFAKQSEFGAGLRRAATAGAVGSLVSTVMIVAWVIHSRVEGALTWYPAVSQGWVAKILGLAAAGTLLWFLETFAVSYDSTTEGVEPG